MIKAESVTIRKKEKDSFAMTPQNTLYRNKDVVTWDTQRGKNRTLAREEKLTVIDRNIQSDDTDLSQHPPRTLDPHGYIVESDTLVVITDHHTRLDAALVRPCQVEGRQQNRIVDRSR
jgi:hypothetical protein